MLISARVKNHAVIVQWGMAVALGASIKPIYSQPTIGNKDHSSATCTIVPLQLELRGSEDK